MHLKEKLTIQNMTVIALTACVYIAATVGLAPISYSIFQFRVSELLNLMAFLNPVHAFGIVLGCFISNFYSPLGIADVIVGTFHSAVSLYFITKSKNLIVATLWPTVFCFILGLEYWVLEGAPFLLTTASIMLGEFVVMTLAGYPLFKMIMNNKRLSMLFSRQHL